MALPEDKTDICNLSLNRIGEKAVTEAQLTADNDPRAQRCNRHYEQTRDALQRSFWWRFARVRIRLASAWATAKIYTTDQYVLNDDVWYKCKAAHTSGDLDDEPGVGAVAGTFWTTLVAADYTPEFEWDFMFDLPAAFLRFRSIDEEVDATSRSKRRAIEGLVLFTNLSEVSMLYIERVTDVTKFDLLYTEVLVLQLALKLVPPTAGVGSAGQALLSELKNELKPLMAQVRSIDRNETDVGGRSDWNLARHGGIGITGQEERFL
jgi:hypothetical protein